MLLVTGGAGFIGRHYLEFHQIHHPEEEVLCIDALTYAADTKFIEQWKLTPHHHFVKARIEDSPHMREIFNTYPITRIINFAAESHVDRSLEDAAPFVRTNVDGVQVLLQLAKEHQVIRYHQVSTDEVYGEMPADPSIQATETFPLKPRNPYAATKAAADLLTLSYYEAYGLNVTISRGTNTYGPYQHKEKLIPRAITTLLSGNPVPIYGDGLQIRDWIYALDHAAGIDCILRHGTSGEIYNLGSHQEKTNLEVVRDILSHFQMSENSSTISHVADRQVHDKRYALSTEKIEKELDWKPKFTWEDTFPLTCNSYK